jgi:hypothetical protein
VNSVFPWLRFGKFSTCSQFAVCLSFKERAALSSPNWRTDGGNLAAVLLVVDDVLDGTAFKHDGVNINPVDPTRVRALI